MTRLRDVIRQKVSLDGTKVKIDDILDQELTFTGWSIGPSKQKGCDEYIILQFEKDGKKHVVMTGSSVLITLVREFESLQGKEPFDAKIVKRKKYYTFE